MKRAIAEILQKIQREGLSRELTFRVEKIDVEKRTVELTFSSETPVERWFGLEILDHKPSSVRLGRLNDGAPVCWLHPNGSSADQRGVVEKAWIDAARGRAVVRFGRSEKAEELFQDVQDGIKRNISMVYYVYKLVLEKEEEGELPVYRAMDWEPVSIDFVPIAADPTIGVGRSKEVNNKPGEQPGVKENRTMEKCQICGKELINGVCPDNCAARAKEAFKTRAAESPAINVREVQEKATRAEADRISAILALGEQHNCPELARAAVKDGISKEDFQGQILEKRYGAKPLNSPSPEIGASEKERKAYSFHRAINACLEGDWKHAGLELEMSRAVEKMLGGKKPQSFYVPYDILIARRDIFDTSGNAGAGAIATNLLTGSFIEALQKRTMVMQMGATILPGLVGDVAIPKQTSTVTTQWKAENIAPDRSRAKIEQLGMTPKTITGYSDISRKLIKQASMAVEAFIQADLIKAIRLAIDLAAINGAGSSTEPEGILKTSGIGSVISGGTLTWGHCVDLWTAVADENADFGSLGYLTNAFVCGELMQTEKATNTAKFVIENLPDANGMTAIGGMRCGISNQVPKTLGVGLNKTALIFGNWADLIIGMWGGLDVLVDPYSQSSTQAVRIVVAQDIDTLVRHAESFAAAQDVST